MRRPRCNFQTFPSPLLSSSNPLLLGYLPAGQVSSPGHNCEAFNAYITLYIYDAMVVPTIMKANQFDGKSIKISLTPITTEGTLFLSRSHLIEPGWYVATSQMGNVWVDWSFETIKTLVLWSWNGKYKRVLTMVIPSEHERQCTIQLAFDSNPISFVLSRYVLSPESNLSHTFFLLLCHGSYLPFINGHICQNGHILFTRKGYRHLIKDSPCPLLVSQLTPVWTRLHILSCTRSTLRDFDC